MAMTWHTIARKDVSDVRKLLVGCIPLLLGALLVGCGQSAAANTGASATATVSAPTATPPSTPTAVGTRGVVNAGHLCSTDTSGQIKYEQIGDLKVSEVHFVLAYPARELPSNLDTSKPYQLPTNAYDFPNPPVNPRAGNGSGYGFTVCNTSRTTSHVIIGVTTTISAFTPYTGKLNVWQFCDSVFARPGGVVVGGCGGAYLADESLQASFSANATTGAQVTATQVGTGDSSGNGGPNAAPLPVSLGPGQMLVFGLGVTPPTAAGAYTFAFGLNYDSVTAAPITTMQPTLFDSAAVKWNGQNCTKPALQSQIPTAATNPPTNYVCAP